MTTIWENSLCWKALSAAGGALRGWWKKGVLCACIEGLKERYQGSGTQRLWVRFCAAPNPAPFSCWFRFMARLRRGLEAVGSNMEKGIFYRVVCWFRDLYFRMTKGSLVFGWINRLSLHQWLLAAFALYLPLNYVIRDILGISLLASVWEEAFLCAAAGLVLWRAALKQTGTIGRATPVNAWVLLFLAVGLFLMCAVQPYPSVAWEGYRAQVTYILWFFLILRLIEDDGDFKVLYAVFLGMAALLSLHGIYQYVIGVEIPSSWVSQTEMGVRTRVFSLTGSPNIFGCFLVMTAPLAAALMYHCRKTWAKLFFFCLTGVMCLSLLFTFSKGAWVGMVVAVVIFAMFLDRRLLAVMGAGVAAVLVAVPSITSRITYLFTSDYAAASAVGGRTLRWEIGRTLLTENDPWLGFGLGRFGGAVAMNNQILDETEDFYYFYMDNYYLKTMVEMGYLGLIFFVLMLLALMVWGLRAVWRSGLSAEAARALAQTEALQARGKGPAVFGIIESGNKEDPFRRFAGSPKALAVGLFSAMAGVLVHCYFENIFEEPYMMAYFWGMGAMLLYLG
ncbi:MAG: O-antigen ligase family protein, partial [Bacillota bacterium]|nr:O-antigen ligase family protein [Bacillota bacterium]